MPAFHPAPSLSRRAALASLGAGALGMALATRSRGAFAQDASPVATAYTMANHPIIGVWKMDNETRQPDTDVSYTVFAADGTYVSAPRDQGGIEVGMWRATGERTVEQVDVLQDLGSQDMFARDYAPEGNLFAPGSVLHRGLLDVDATGTTVTLKGTVEFRNADGTVQGSGEFEGLGTRMGVVEMPGTPTS